MNHHYKAAAQVILGLLGFAGLLLLSIFYLRGVVWASAAFIPGLVAAGAIALIVCNVFLLPLSAFKRTRPWTGHGYYYSSYVFGTLLFAYSCIVAYEYWGYVGLFVGLFIAGIGVVPIAYLATILHHDWQIVGNLVVGTAATFGLRAFGIYLASEKELDEITKRRGFAYEQLKTFDNRFDFDATVLTWRFIHQALEIALSKGYTSTEIARSFTQNLAQAIAESGAIVPERAERRIALSATGPAWRGIHSTLLGILVRDDCRLEQALAMNESQREHIRSFTDRLEVALVGWGVLSVAQVNEIRQQSLSALFEATTIDHGGSLPVMTQAIWENEYGGIGLPTEAEISEKLAELQTEIKQRECFAKELEERAGQAAGNRDPRVEQEASKQTAGDTKAAPGSPWEIRDEDIPF